MTNPVVIVGAGHAGCQLAASLREACFTGQVVLLGDEPTIPYQRPPLSKSFLKGAVEMDALQIRSGAYFRERQIDYRSGVRVVEIERALKAAVLSTGDRVEYDQLVLATGVRNRHLTLPHANAPGVLSLRTLPEAQALRDQMSSAQHAVIIGAGFIGMEFASVARQAGLAVTVVDRVDRLLSRSASPAAAAVMEARHRAEGVAFEFGTGVDGFDLNASGKLAAVRLTNSRVLRADLALIAIGVVPNVELAQDAGLAVENGIVVNNRLQTSDDAIFAIGDCASYPHPAFADGPVRLESVQNAADQARFLAGILQSGRGAEGYCSVPWFWSDQYDIKFQVAGLRGPNDDCELLGDPKSAAFAFRHSRGGQLTALETFNQAREHMLARNEIKQAITRRLALTTEASRQAGPIMQTEGNAYVR